MTTIVLGVDPGPTTGICLLTRDGPPLAYSCCAAAAYGLVCWLIEANEGPARIIAAGEAFVPGGGAGARMAGAAVTRELISDLDDLMKFHWRSAAAVKPWAADRRLEAAGLLNLTMKMRDARDAARHALFAAVHDAGWPDPLSRKGS